MARKTIIVVWLVALVLVPLRLVEAQQPAKVAKIGYLITGGSASAPGPEPSYSGASYVRSVMLRART
jgi:hypothetical protein